VRTTLQIRDSGQADPPPAVDPVTPPHGSQDGIGPEAGPAPEPGSGTTAGIRLLIVDDHPVVRQGLELLFSTVPGVEVVGLAADGRNAVDLASALAPDVVLMDIGMPGIDGIEATRRMMSARQDLSVIVLTGYTDTERLNQALQAGARRCLFKHGGYEEVIDAVLTAAAEPR
jgi:DNA-binding NarL/FixJ family response regulator